MRFIRRAPLHALLILLSAVMLYPIAVMILTALKPNSEVLQNPVGLPIAPTLENFVTSWQVGHFDRLFLNSIIFTVSSMVVATFVASLASYAVVRAAGRWASRTHLVLVAGIFLPIQLAIVPQFRVLKDLDLINSYAGVILVYIATAIPFGVFLMAAFMRDLPEEVTEAATLDGAGYFAMYWRIYLPLTRPAIATFWILQGVAVWNDFLTPLVLISDSSKQPLTTGVMLFKQVYLAQWGNIMASVILMVLPIVVLYIFAQKYFLRGLYAGAIK